jgi:ribosome-associated heat shock protein Hsp15
VRLDTWLDIACLFKTRSEAQKACKGGKIDINGQTARPHREVRIGDEIEISRPFGRRQRLILRGIAEQHIAKAEARELYEDVTPPPTPDEIEHRKMARLVRSMSRPTSAGAPDKRDRRALRRLKRPD